MNDKQYYAKKWLNEIYVLSHTELAEKEEILAKTEAAITGGAIDYSKDKIQSDNAKSQEQRQITYSLIMSQVEEIKEKIALLESTRISAIDKVNDSTLRALLLARYINQKPWNDICNVLGYSYRHIQRLHLVALDKIAEFIPKEV